MVWRFWTAFLDSETNKHVHLDSGNVYSGFNLATSQYLINSGRYPTGRRASRPSPQLLFVRFLLVGGVVVYVSITRWVLLSKASTCTCLVWGKHRNLSYYFSILNLTHAACVWTVILCNDNVWICMDSNGCHQPVLIGSPPTSSTCTRLCLPAALSTWAANVASLRTVGTLHGFASGKLGIYPGHPIMFPIVEKVNSNICRMYPLNQFNIFDRSERNIGI